MTIGTLKFSDDLVEKAKTTAKTQKRSITEQIEYWANIGMIALQNPDLPINFIINTLKAKEEYKDGKFSEYKF
jgi:hypothetical protein